MKKTEQYPTVGFAAVDNCATETSVLYLYCFFSWLLHLWEKEFFSGQGETSNKFASVLFVQKTTLCWLVDSSSLLTVCLEANRVVSGRGCVSGYVSDDTGWGKQQALPRIPWVFHTSGWLRRPQVRGEPRRIRRRAEPVWRRFLSEFRKDQAEDLQKGDMPIRLHFFPSGKLLALSDGLVNYRAAICNYHAIERCYYRNSGNAFSVINTFVFVCDCASVFLPLV